MSLEQQNEESETENSADLSENVQFARPVTPFYSIILVACLVAVFVCQLIFDSKNYIAGVGGISGIVTGFVKPFFNEGQYWRILTGATVHGGFLHLMFNGYALFSFGKLVEILSNRAHLAIVFLLSIIGGGILSLIFLPDGNSVGASGGVVGLLGYVTIYAFKRRKLLPSGFLKNMLINIGLLAFVGIFILPKVDNFAHLGGLLVGLVYGFLQVSGDLYKDTREAGQAAKIFGIAALGIFILTSIFSILLLLEVITIKFPIPIQ